MAEKTEDALGGIAAPKAEEAKSAAKTYETPLKEAYEAGDLPAPESAVGGTGNGSGVRPADPNGPEERIARLRRQSAWLAAAFVFLFVFMMVVWMNDVSRAVIFWMWVVGTVGIFILSVRLWLALVREDEKKAKRIRDRDVRYRKTLALLPEGVAILGEGWRIDWVNARGAEHFGIAPEMIGRSFFDVVTDERLRHWLFERNFAGRCNYTSKAGLDLDVSVVAPDSRHMMIVTHDVTERLRIDEMRRDFVANVSHELKTPLTAISGYAELMENGMVPPEEIGSFAQKIEKNARRLLSLINDIIRLSELDSSNTQLLVEKFDLFEEAQICVENMQIYAEKNDVTITYEGGHQEITANREMINELINNLCANAIRYNKKNGSVKVRVDSSQGHPYISVADTGIGISKEHQKRVFERFYRVDKSRSKQTGGTGLGLAIVKHIVALHDAQLNLESEIGKGTTITVTF